MTMGAVIWCAIVGLLVAGIVAMIREPKRGSGIASLTAFHDLQPTDKQRAMETIIEEKSDHRRSAQASGERNERSQE